MLIISNNDVTELLSMNDCIRVQEEAFKKLPYGGAIHRPRIDVYMPAIYLTAITVGARWKGPMTATWRSA